MGSLRVWRCASLGCIVIAALAVAAACGDTLPDSDGPTDAPVRDGGSSDADAASATDGEPPIEECKDPTSQRDHCGACGR